MTGFWEKYGEGIEKESTSGARQINQVIIELGYKLYIGGVDQADTFFAVENPGDEDEREHQKRTADIFRQEQGYTGRRGRPQYGFQVTRIKEGSKILIDDTWEEPTWKHDLYVNVDAWRRRKNVKTNVVPATFKELSFDIFVSTLEEAGITSVPYEGYVTLRWFDRPYDVSKGEAGKTSTGPNGEDTFPTSIAVVQAFDSLEEALTAMGGEVKADPADVAFPPEEDSGELPSFLNAEEWDLETWLQVADELKAHRAENNLTPSQLRNYAATEYEIKMTMKDAITVTR